MKKFTIALLSCLVAIGITLFLVGLGMAGWNFKNLNEGGPFEVKSVDTQETVENIYIVAKDAEIVLKPSEDGKFKAEYQENKRYLYDVKLSDGEFRLTDITRRKWYHYLFSFNFTTPRIVLYLNAQQLENVSLSTRNAGIRSESTLEALRFTAETSNAGITVCNLASQTTISLSSSNGKITAENLSAVEGINIGTSNGKIILRSVQSATMDAHTSNGAVSAESVTAENIRFKTTNESVSALSVSADSLYMETSNAHISADKIDGKNIQMYTSNSRVSASIRGRREDFLISSRTSNASNNLGSTDSGSRRLTVKTSNGNIDVGFLG